MTSRARRGRKKGRSACLRRRELLAATAREIAFTLIELLVVISIIAILAALVFPAARAAAAVRTKSRARAELKEIETYVEIYKTSLNYYPPSGLHNDPMINPLYYELAGTLLANGVYTTLDGVSRLGAADVNLAFNLTGFANSMEGSGSDDGQRVQDFLKNILRQGQAMVVPVTNYGLQAASQVVVLGSSINGANSRNGINPFGYNSANPTNNPNSYDLWLDIFVGGTPTRICNWIDKPIKLQ